jgi:hypothetical protein
LRQRVVIAGDLTDDCRLLGWKSEVLIGDEEAVDPTEIDAAEEVGDVQIKSAAPAAETSPLN